MHRISVGAQCDPPFSPFLSNPQLHHPSPACPAPDPLVAMASFGPETLEFSGGVGEQTFWCPGPSSHLASLPRAGPQVRAEGRRWAAAYLGRTGPGAAERLREQFVARGRAQPGRARVTTRGGGCGAPVCSCQALPPSAGLATPACDRGRARRRAMSSRVRPLLRASPRPRGHRLRAPGSASGTLAPRAC